MRIQETKDYSKFDLHPFNREVQKTKELELSMREHGFIPACPLHCVRGENGKILIKQGHHRFVVAKELGIPVRYVVSKDTIDIPHLEKTHRPWSLTDYLYSHSKAGSESYLAVLEYQKRTGIPLVNCISMIWGESAGSHNRVEDFKKGTFRVGDTTHAEIVADIVLFCKNKCKLDFATTATFVTAVSRIVKVAEFEPSQLKRKISTFRSLLERRPTAKMYVELLDEVYNRQCQTKIPLAFLSEQVARHSNPIHRGKKT